MRSFEVSIMGQRLRFKSDASETEIEELVRVLGDRVEALRRKTRVVSTQSLALMAALDCADELRRERARRSEARQEIEALLALAEEALASRAAR